jgi:hypothetical protein
MGETIANRLNRLREAGVHILSVEGLLSETCNSMSKTFGLELDGRPADRSYTELLAYFSDRGNEHIIGERKSVATDQNNPMFSSSERLAERWNISKGWENFKHEVHAIEDTKTKTTHYFAMPHRKYF